jgi:hypothetical protein
MGPVAGNKGKMVHVVHLKSPAVMSMSLSSKVTPNFASPLVLSAVEQPNRGRNWLMYDS